MHFYDQTWFWAPLFAVMGSLGAIVIKEWLGGKTGQVGTPTHT